MKWLIDPVVGNTLVHGARQFCVCILDRRFHKLFSAYFHIPQFFFLANCQFLWKAFLISSTLLQVWLASKEEPCKRILFVGNVCLWLWWESTYWLNSCVFQTNYVLTKKLRYICMMVDWLGFFLILVGLLITYVALNLMDGHGQPALLYIVPFTLGSFYEKDHYFITTFFNKEK